MRLLWHWGIMKHYHLLIPLSLITSLGQEMKRMEIFIVLESCPTVGLTGAEPQAKRPVEPVLGRTFFRFCCLGVRWDFP